LHPETCILHPETCILHPETCITLKASPLRYDPLWDFHCVPACILKPASCILKLASCILHPETCILNLNQHQS